MAYPNISKLKWIGALGLILLLSLLLLPLLLKKAEKPNNAFGFILEQDAPNSTSFLVPIGPKDLSVPVRIIWRMPEGYKEVDVLTTSCSCLKPNEILKENDTFRLKIPAPVDNSRSLKVVFRFTGDTQPELLKEVSFEVVKLDENMVYVPKTVFGRVSPNQVTFKFTAISSVGRSMKIQHEDFFSSLRTAHTTKNNLIFYDVILEISQVKDDKAYEVIVAVDNLKYIIKLSQVGNYISYSD